MELLKDEGNGLNRRETVKDLTAKFGCVEATVYNDFNTRSVWQPLVQEIKASLFKIQNRHEQLYRKASFERKSPGAISQAIADLAECALHLMGAFLPGPKQRASNYNTYVMFFHYKKGLFFQENTMLKNPCPAVGTPTID